MDSIDAFVQRGTGEPTALTNSVAVSRRKPRFAKARLFALVGLAALAAALGSAIVATRLIQGAHFAAPPSEPPASAQAAQGPAATMSEAPSAAPPPVAANTSPVASVVASAPSASSLIGAAPAPARRGTSGARPAPSASNVPSGVFPADPFTDPFLVPSAPPRPVPSPAAPSAPRPGDDDVSKLLHRNP
jgi:hypothetical protein